MDTVKAKGAACVVPNMNPDLFVAALDWLSSEPPDKAELTLAPVMAWLVPMLEDDNEFLCAVPISLCKPLSYTHAVINMMTLCWWTANGDSGTGKDTLLRERVASINAAIRWEAYERSKTDQPWPIPHIPITFHPPPGSPWGLIEASRPLRPGLQALVGVLAVPQAFRPR